MNPGTPHATGNEGRFAHVSINILSNMLIVFGFLLQWPTIRAFVMFPILVWMYARLAKAEERQVRAEFPEAYVRAVSAFIPSFRGFEGEVA